MGVYLEDITFSYGEHVILSKVSMQVKKGENIGIIGESGCGKTTLLKLISGLYEKQTGILKVAGESEPAEIRKNVAMRMQTGYLFPTSIRDNITCGHQVEKEKLMKACRAAQLTEWLHSLEDGLDTYVGERGSRVSGGQAQRIAIARALVKDASVVLLDEVTSALDETTEGSLMEALNRLIIGKTVIHVSHRKKVLQNCDRIYKMEAGRIFPVHICD